MLAIVAGCRDYEDYASFITEMNKYNDITEIISGGASGVDSMAIKYANENNIKLTVFYADWKTYGKSAGPIRNRKMAEYCKKSPNSRLIAFWDMKSPGTKNMIYVYQSIFGIDTNNIHIIKL